MKTETLADDTQDGGDGDKKYARQRRWPFAEACNDVQQHPVPEKRNAPKCGQYDRTMGEVRGRDARTILTVVAGRDAA